MSKSIAADVINNRIVKSTELSYTYSRQVLATVLPLVLIDFLCLLSCYAISFSVLRLLGFLTAAEPCHWIVLVLGLGMFVSYLIIELYDAVGMHPVYEFRQMTLCNSMLYVLVTSTLVFQNNPVWMLPALMYPMLVVCSPIARAVARSVLAESDWWGVKCLVFSADRRAEELFSNHLSNRFLGIKPVGFLQESLPDRCSEEVKKYYAGSVDRIHAVSKERDAHVALVHQRGRTSNDLQKYVDDYLRSFVRIVTQPDDSRLPSVQAIGRNGGISFEDRLMLPSSKIIKRAVDLSVSCFVLAVGFPFLAVIAIWLKVADPGPLFFGHERICKNGRRFKAWKFRTMAVNGQEILDKHLAENSDAQAEWDATYKLQNDPRVSIPGKLLRKSSLDELPQLWNIVRGDMSLVGPRPIVVGEVERYESILENYVRVQPGLTGLWQVSGRNLTTYDRRVELDDFYVRNWSVWFDFYIIGRTFKTVLLREGAF